MDDQARIRQYLTRHSAGAPDEARVTALAGDVSSRRYYRVTPAGGGAAAGLPAILTLYPEPFDVNETAGQRLDRLLRANPDAMLSYANDPLAQIEMTRFLAAQGLPVPELRGADGPLGIIAFEDLGDVRLIEALEPAGPAVRRALYRRAVDLILELQDATSAMLRAGVIGARLEFSTAKLMWEMEFFLTHYFEGCRGHALTDVEHRRVTAELEPLCRWLAERPQVLCHRDYHARNLMFLNDTLYLIDYQDSRRGPATYDLVSLLLDPYVPADFVEIDPLFEHYLDRCGGTERDALRLEWQAMAIQRLLKASGTYAYQVARRGVTVFEAYLKPTLERVERTLEARGGMPFLRSLLAG
jgi:hypothetical protein